jgi:hypothetical protein
VAIADASITEDQSNIEVELENGTVLKRFVECSVGNIKKPFVGKTARGQVSDQARVPQVDRLIEMCWGLDRLDES